MKAFSGNDKVGKIANDFQWSREIFKKHGVYVSNEGDHEIMKAVNEHTSDVDSILGDLNAAYSKIEGQPEMDR